MISVLGVSPSFAASAQKQPPQKQEHTQKQEPQKKKTSQKGKSEAKPKAAQPGKKPGSKTQKSSAKAQHQPNWKKKGGKMPQNARGPQVDYRQHRLKKPPQGYRWVRNGDDFVLIAITTGIISAIVNANR